jgi:hypothetical protein
MFQQQLHNLRKLFQKYRGAHPKLNSANCKLFQKEMWFLGHIVSPGVNTDQEKVGARKLQQQNGVPELGAKA